MTRKYVYYVGVLSDRGCRFVTGLHPTCKYAFWKDGEKAKAFSMSVADDITLGLLMNFHYAFTVKVPDGVEFHNPISESEEE